MSNYQFQYHFQIDPSSSLPPNHIPYNSWPPVNPFFSYKPAPVSVIAAQPADECAIYFVISAVLFGIFGAFISAASANSAWSPEVWDWNDPNTPVSILSGAVGGILVPYGFFYSNATLGMHRTLTVASAGAYLGAATMNKRWNPFLLPGWDWTSPTTYHGAFEGMQSTVWLIDATTSIHDFTDEFDVQGGARGAFVALSYGTGAGIAYHYVSQYNDGNYTAWDRVLEPGTVFAIVDGIESGTRLPVGFAEIGIDIANRTKTTITGPGGSSFKLYLGEGTFSDIDPWSIFGAGFMAFVYASEENRTFDWTKWDWNSFSTLEAILNGIVYGKDLPEMVRDVQTAFRQKRRMPGTEKRWSGLGGWSWQYMRRGRDEAS